MSLIVISFNFTKAKQIVSARSSILAPLGLYEYLHLGSLSLAWTNYRHRRSRRSQAMSEAGEDLPIGLHSMAKTFNGHYRVWFNGILWRLLVSRITGIIHLLVAINRY